MRDSTEWNLVAAGPSRKHLMKHHLLDGPVVTINRAIDVVEQEIHVDIAAFADGPGGCWDKMGLMRYWRPGMNVWVSTRPVGQKIKVEGTNEKVEVPGPPVAKLWDQALPLSVGMRFMPWGSLKALDSPDRERHAFTTYCALRGILRYKPKKVRILCMDMKGSWVAGKTEAECHEHDMKDKGLDRWAHERFHMKALMREARKVGVEVEKMIPQEGMAYTATEKEIIEPLDGGIVH